jgi:hypothetical protein
MSYRLKIEEEPFEYEEPENTLELSDEDLEDFENNFESDVLELPDTEQETAGTSGLRIEDRMSIARKDRRKGRRDPSTVKYLVLHQMAFSRGNNPDRYNAVTAHYAILPNGRILQLHPVSALLWASNGFNRKSVAVEFAGNFPNTRGKCWETGKYGCHKLTQAQIAAGRYLVKHLIEQIGLTHIFAHRQAAKTRENCPGPDIWYHIGQWAIDNMGLKDGGPGYKIDLGHAIPDAWRNWGRSIAKEFEAYPEYEDTETATPPPRQKPAALYKQGSKGHGVWVIQRLLNVWTATKNSGVTPLKEDGKFGQKTASSVRSFQRSNNLTVDGIVGPQTWSQLLDKALPAPRQEQFSEIGEITTTAHDIMCYLPEQPHPTDIIPTNQPLVGTFNAVVMANKAAAKKLSAPSYFDQKLLEYSKYSIRDGAFLLGGYLRCPSFYEGGLILKANPKAGAITLDKSVFCAKGNFNIDTYVHELVHVAQYKLTGIIVFLQTYFGIAAATIFYRWARGIPINEMRANPHENQAYEIEKRFSKWLALHP